MTSPGLRAVDASDVCGHGSQSGVRRVPCENERWEKELGVTLRPCGDLRPENAMENHEIWDLNREKTIILLGEVDDFPLSGNQEIIVHCHGAVPEGKPDHFHHLCHASTAACNTEISARTWMDFAVCLKRIYKGIWDMSWYGNLSKIDLIFFKKILCMFMPKKHRRFLRKFWRIVTPHADVTIRPRYLIDMGADPAALNLQQEMQNGWIPGPPYFEGWTSTYQLFGGSAR